ncbi:MAG: SPFH/Band 7/PHB domain protein, partial [Bdellovibrionales bacterium]|nr:SPFH/Band 7/PHB domain protein [Bdellovibrionales bacterium]
GIFAFILIAFAVVTVFSCVKIVPQQQAFVVERWGKYYGTLNAGLHFVIPFMDLVRYKHTLKEIVLDIPEQVCITKDNVQVTVDGIIFFRVIDPQKASYGVGDYEIGLIQLAQTTLRSEVGKIDLDRTFEERERINASVVHAIDKASDPWGVKVLRYELKSINPPRDVLAAMEKQMRAEREKRAHVLESEGERDAKINRAEGDKQQVIKNSEAFRQRQINDAEGQAQAILSIAAATADGISRVAESLNSQGGDAAARLKIAEDYIKQFGALAKTNNTMIVPMTVADVAGTIASAMAIFRGTDVQAGLVPPPSSGGTPQGGGKPPRAGV